MNVNFARGDIPVRGSSFFSAAADPGLGLNFSPASVGALTPVPGLHSLVDRLAGLFPSLSPSLYALPPPSVGAAEEGGSPVGGLQQQHPCEKCGEVFRSKVALRRHETYVCNNTNAIFSTINQQFKQQQIHQQSSKDGNNSDRESNA